MEAATPPALQRRRRPRGNMPAPPEPSGSRGKSPAFERRRIHAASRHGRLEPRSRPWIWAVYVFLFTASVPWYLPPGSPARLWFGLPHWVVISLLAYLAVAVFTAYVVTRYWSVPPDEDADDTEGAP